VTPRERRQKLIELRPLLVARAQRTLKIERQQGLLGDEIPPGAWASGRRSVKSMAKKREKDAHRGREKRGST
jgi:hypothetical protein